MDGKSIKILRNQIQTISKKFDSITSGELSTVCNDRETAEALRNIMEYTKGISFMEVLNPKCELGGSTWQK